MERTASQILLAAYQECPDLPVLRLQFSRAADQVLTYREIVGGAAHWAAAFEAAGIQPGDVCILILQHGPELALSFFGAMLRGAVPSIMPFLTEKLSPEHYRASLAALFEITRPAAVITYPEFLGEVSAVLEAMPDCPVRSLLVAGEPFPASPAEGEVRFVPPAVVEPDPALLPGLQTGLDDIALLQHSSGTTGLQKGVALSHRAIHNQLDSYSAALGLNEQDVIVSWLPLYHDMGLIAGFLLPLLTRTPLVLLSPFDWVRAPYRLLQSVSRFRGTLTWLPNFAYNFCAQKIRDRDLDGVDLSSWRAVINCSEPMHAESQRLFSGRFAPYGLRPEALATCYAMAENVFAVTQGGIEAPVRVDPIQYPALISGKAAIPAAEAGAAVEMLSAGRPIEGVQIRILDEKGQELPERRVGEIALRSHCMLTGYYRRPDLTQKAFRDGWYLTGDLGYLADEELYITGRKKDLIIVGGKNIYPQDLERIAGEVPGVHPGRAAAFGVYNPAAGTEDVVLIAESDEDPQTYPQIAEAVRRAVTQKSEVALRLVEITRRGWLLKTSSGKVARGANRDRYLSGTPGSVKLE